MPPLLPTSGANSKRKNSPSRHLACGGMPEKHVSGFYPGLSLNGPLKPYVLASNLCKILCFTSSDVWMPVKTFLISLPKPNVILSWPSNTLLMPAASVLMSSGQKRVNVPQPIFFHRKNVAGRANCLLASRTLRV